MKYIFYILALVLLIYIAFQIKACSSKLPVIPIITINKNTDSLLRADSLHSKIAKDSIQKLFRGYDSLKKENNSLHAGYNKLNKDYKSTLQDLADAVLDNTDSGAAQLIAVLQSKYDSLNGLVLTDFDNEGQKDSIYALQSALQETLRISKDSTIAGLTRNYRAVAVIAAAGLLPKHYLGIEAGLSTFGSAGVQYLYETGNKAYNFGADYTTLKTPYFHIGVLLNLKK